MKLYCATNREMLTDFHTATALKHNFFQNFSQNKCKQIQLSLMTYHGFITDNKLVGLYSSRHHHLGPLYGDNTLEACVSRLGMRQILNLQNNLLRNTVGKQNLLLWMSEPWAGIHTVIGQLGRVLKKLYIHFIYVIK